MADDRGLMASEAGLHVDYRPLAVDASAGWEGVLGIASFDARGPGVDAPGPSVAVPGPRVDAPGPNGAGSPWPVPGVSPIPMADIRTPVLASGKGICEIWRLPQQLESGQHARVRYRRSEQILFGCISIAESLGLQAATSEAYREIFTTLDGLAYPHLLRVWNYLPHINAETDGSERYWQFNNARRHTLIASGRHAAGNVPAACALGSVDGSPLVIYFLASRVAPLLVENPRQVSAYDYPSQYGPKPAFSRASLVRDARGAILFVSGTASIVGHQTLHAGDVAAQTRETLVNIEALLAQANRMSGTSSFGLGSLAYKVYVRHAEDLPLIRAELDGALGADARVVYLLAEICRRDLLVEIEAAGRI